MENLGQQHATAGVSKETSESLLAGWNKGPTQHTNQGGNDGVAGVREGSQPRFLQSTPIP